MEHVLLEELLLSAHVIMQEASSAQLRPRDEYEDEATIAKIQHHLACMSEKLTELHDPDAAVQAFQSAVDKAESTLGLCYGHRFAATFPVLRETIDALRAEIRLAESEGKQRQSQQMNGRLSAQSATDLLRYIKSRLAALLRAGGSKSAEDTDSTPTRDTLNKLSRDIQIGFRADRRADGTVDRELCPPSRSFSLTEARRAVDQKSRDTEDSRQNFSGYQREVERLRAKLGLLANVQFVLMPGGDYALGGDALQTVCPLSGSTAGSARLDRRSKLELRYLNLTNALPDPILFVSRPRRLNLVPLLVTRTVVTRTQYAALLKNPKLKLPELPGGWLRDNVAVPAFFNREVEAIELRKRRLECSDALLVPFFIAETIARQLGCSLVPFDSHEALVSGCEGHSHLTVASHADNISTVGWSEATDGNTRVLDGISTRIVRATIGCIKTPNGTEATGYPEWNTFELSTTKVDGCTTHCLRSVCDFASQTLLESESERDDVPFVGLPSYSYATPNCGVPLAAFRLAIPATQAGKLLFDQLSEAEHARRGLHLTLNDIFSVCVSRNKAQVLEELRPAQFDNWSTDPLYGNVTGEMRAAGVGLTFAAEPPHNFLSVTLFCANELADETLPPFERLGYSYEVPAQKLKAEFKVTSQSLIEFVSAFNGSVHDCGGYVEFEDEFTLPPTAHTPFSQSLRLRHRLCRRGSAFCQVQIDLLSTSIIVT